MYILILNIDKIQGYMVPKAKSSRILSICDSILARYFEVSLILNDLEHMVKMIYIQVQNTTEEQPNIVTVTQIIHRMLRKSDFCFKM